MSDAPNELPFLAYAKASLGEEEINEVVAALRSGWLSMGPRTRQFEEEFSKAFSTRHAISVNSATSGLFLLLHALGIGPGDEVIVPSITFAASANVVVHTGATPVLVDVNRTNFCLDVGAVAAAVTPRTKAIVAVHFAGAVADMDALEKIAGNKILIVEDAAHAVGARYPDGSWVGSRHPAAFSFYATKNLTTGEGGMMTVKDEALATRLRALRLHGISQDAWKRYSKDGSWYYEVVEHGYKMNMTDLNAAIGLHQLKKIMGFNQRRREIAKTYDAAFADLPVHVPTFVSADSASAHLYPLLTQDAADRDRLFAGLKEKGIGTSLHFIPLHLMPAFQKNFGYQKGQLPNAEWFYERTVALPLYPALTEADIARVIDGVRSVFVKC